MSFLFWLAVRTVVFGIALTYASRSVRDLKIEPRSALPLVAFTFAILNALLYSLLKSAFNLATLWTLFLVTPFLANGALLWLTDRLMKPLKIEGLRALAVTAAIMTLAHALLRIVENFV